MKCYLVSLNLRRPIMQGLLGFTALTLVITGCASGTQIAQTAKAGVYIEEVTDWSFEASHPAVIDQLTITKIVKGLYRTDSQSGSSRMSAGGSKPMRIFSDEDAEFLAPLLAQGLAKAKPDQLVGFRVSSSAGSGSEPTTGSIYVQNGSIYMTISKGNKPTGFMPESAAHSENAPAYAAGGVPGAMSMIIDYRALAKASMPAAIPTAKIPPSAPIAVMAAAPATVQTVSRNMSQDKEADDSPTHKPREIDAVNDELARKDREINMLRKESEWMKRELRERDEDIKSIKKATVVTKPLTKTTVSAKPAPKKKQANATQTP